MCVGKLTNGLMIKQRSNDEQEKANLPTSIRFVILEDGRLVPVEPGGMVELALSELGAKVVEVFHEGESG
jgi:hypothetical protein